MTTRRPLLAYDPDSDFPELAILNDVLARAKPDRYIALLELRDLARKTNDPGRWVHAARFLRTTGVVSPEVGLTLMAPFVDATIRPVVVGDADVETLAQQVTDRYDVRLLPADALSTPAMRPALSEWIARRSQLECDYLRSIGDAEWADMGGAEWRAKRLELRAAGERELFGCEPAVMLGVMILLRAPRTVGENFHARVVQYLTSWEMGTGRHWHKVVGRGTDTALITVVNDKLSDLTRFPLPLPSPRNVESEMPELQVLTEIVESRPSEAYRRMEFLGMVAAHTHDSERWIRAAQSLRDSGRISLEVSWFLMDDFVRCTAIERTRTDPAIAAARAELESLSKAFDPDEMITEPQTAREEVLGAFLIAESIAARARYLRELGETEWAAVVASGEEADQERLRAGQVALYGRDMLDFAFGLAYLTRHIKSRPPHDQTGVRYLRAIEDGGDPDEVQAQLIAEMEAAQG